MKRLLRAQDVAVILNISRSLAYRLLQSGKLPVIRVERSVRIRPEDLEAYIISNRVESQSMH